MLILLYILKGILQTEKKKSNEYELLRKRYTLILFHFYTNIPISDKPCPQLK